MYKRSCLTMLQLLVFALIAAGVVRADTLNKIVSISNQGWNDTLVWSQKGGDGTVLGSSFSANTSSSNAVTVGLSAPNSIISVVCSANPCSWTTAGLTPGHSLLWTSDAGNGGTGPITLNFAKSIAGAGAYLQADAPGAYTAQIQVYNGSSSLGSYTLASDNAGDPMYLGVVDQTGANITKVVFSLTTCSGSCNDFALETVVINEASGTAPKVSFTPGSLSFPTTTVGSTMTSPPVTLSNTGNATLNISSLGLTGSGASSFYISSNTCGSSVAAGGSCSFYVTFKPTAVGSFSAALAVNDNASGSPQQLPLSGTGQAATSGLTLNPSSLSFSNGVVGTTTPAQTVVITNNGSGTVTMHGISLTGSNASSFLELNTCGGTLPAHATCSVAVSSKPASTGSLTAALSVSSSASGTPQTAALSASVSAQPLLSFGASSLAFGTTAHGTTSPASVLTISNTGSTAATFSSISVGGSQASDFTELTTCGATLNGGSSCQVFVSFRPAATGNYAATLFVYSNATGSPRSTNLSGTGS